MNGQRNRTNLTDSQQGGTVQSSMVPAAPLKVSWLHYWDPFYVPDSSD